MAQDPTTVPLSRLIASLAGSIPSVQSAIAQSNAQALAEFARLVAAAKNTPFEEALRSCAPLLTILQFATVEAQVMLEHDVTREISIHFLNASFVSRYRSTTRFRSKITVNVHHVSPTLDQMSASPSPL